MGDRQAQVDELFRQMVLNGLDFIDHAIEALLSLDEETNEEVIRKALKYSVIHFGSGVEVLLKARLLKEHWTLIVAQDRKTPTFDQLKSGALKTVDMVQAIERLENVVGTEFPKPAKEALQKIRNHRNQAIHFRPSDKIKDVAIEQLRAWHYLHKLLNRIWEDAFEKFKLEITLTNDKLSHSKKYLAQKFELVKPDIKQAIDKGHQCIECYICGYEATITDSPVGIYVSTECLVCISLDEYYHFVCPICKKSHFTPAEINHMLTYMECCGEDISIKTLAEQGFDCDVLLHEGFSLKELVDADTFPIEQLHDIASRNTNQKPIYCPNCHTQHTFHTRKQSPWLCLDCAVEYEDSYICHDCKHTIADSSHDKSEDNSCICPICTPSALN